MSEAPPSNRNRTSLLLAAVLIAATAAAIAWFARRDEKPGDAPAGVDLVDGTRAQAAALGLTLPGPARHVHIKARAAQGATVRYIRFDLNRESYRSYRADLARRPGADMSPLSAIPADWPRFRELKGFEPPAWYLQYFKVPNRVPAFVGPRAVAGQQDLVEAELWILDDTSYRVYLWSWVTPRRFAPSVKLRGPHRG